MTSITAERLFKEFSSFQTERATISIFHVKCIIMRLFGQNVPVKTIGNTLVNECKWVKNGTGVTLSNFIQLLNALHDELGLDEHRSYFSDFDTSRKGWINENDFVSVRSLFEVLNMLHSMTSNEGIS